MAFVFEKVPEKDYEFFKSMGLKNFWGTDSLSLSKGDTTWCANREKNAYLVAIGGGHADIPEYHDLWWNGHIVRMETLEAGNGNYDTGVNIIWIIKKIPIPRSIWIYKDDVLQMINEAFSVDLDWCRAEHLKSISVKIECEPEMVEEK